MSLFIKNTKILSKLNYFSFNLCHNSKHWIDFNNEKELGELYEKGSTEDQVGWSRVEP